MNLPSKLIFAGRPHWTGMGAVTVTSDLTSAASALTTFLVTTGCVTTAFDACSAFQTAYNAAGGGNQTLVVDGLYGPATEAALQEVNDQQGGGSAPAACVAGHNAGGGGGGTSTASLVPGGGSSATVNVFGTQVSTKTLIIAAGAAAMLAIVGAAMFKTHADGTTRTRWRTRRAPKRRRRGRRRAHARRRHGRRRR